MDRTRPIKVDLVVGARPNFVKAAAILEAAKKFPQLIIRLIHTGQHHGIMSYPYFQDLQLPEPIQLSDDIDLGLGFGSMIGRLDYFWYKQQSDTYPDCVMVVGDTDSTAAAAIAAAKVGIPVVHVEAGLRCGDMKMQEEINRIIVDSIATRHYTTSEFADENLEREGKRGIRVGNVMIDSLVRYIDQAKALYPHQKATYAVLTLHRAENADVADRMKSILLAVEDIGSIISVVWPVHPRYKPAQTDFITIVPPAGYLEFLALLAGAKFVMTDSGGVQEEASALGIPCMTLRDNTERPETVFCGTNRVVGTDYLQIAGTAHEYLRTTIDYTHLKPEGYDGHAAERLLEDLCHAMS